MISTKSVLDIITHNLSAMQIHTLAEIKIHGVRQALPTIKVCKIYPNLPMFYNSGTFALISTAALEIHLWKNITNLYVQSQGLSCGRGNLMYGLLTKCEVKMAGYWSSSFFARLWTTTKWSSINLQKKRTRPVSSHLD